MRKPRRAGLPWRVLAHEGLNGPSHRVRSGVEIPAGAEFDELVVGKWCHIEQMDTGSWWMNIGGVTLWVRADRDGKARSVAVYGPDAYAQAVPDCRYELSWRDENGLTTEASA